jgi:hypothetical protein
MISFFKKKKKPAQKSREDLIAEAKKNTEAARAAIGEETLEKIRKQMMGEGNSPLEQARRQIMAMDKERIADNIRATYREDRDT